MPYKLFFILTSLWLLSCKPTQYKNPHIIIYTNYGEIEVELYPDKAPKTVAAFLSFIDAGYYTNSSFYRVIKEDDIAPADNHGLIQGGIWKNENSSKPFINGIMHESTKLTGLSHTNGTISLARTTPGSATTEFFICIGNQTQFDYGNATNGDQEGFAAFGSVFKGMKYVREIQSQRSNGDQFYKNIVISKIKRR